VSRAASGQTVHTAAVVPQRPALPYLAGYPESLRVQIQQLIDADKLGEVLRQRYPEQRHSVQTDRALYDYTIELKDRYLRSSVPLAKVGYDAKLHIIRNALGTHTTIARVQGGKLKAKREIRVAQLFRQAAPEFLKMIVVHELAHLREREHDKAFYALCTHMEPDYHQYEFDLRLWLTWRELTSSAADSPVEST
jgi:predicted metal-dependent hydrolase